MASSSKSRIFKNNPNKQVEEAPEWEILDGRPSKTEQKKAVLRMKGLAEQLSELSVKQILKLPLREETIAELVELTKITSFEARRRQYMRLGKLLREENETEIISALSGRQGIRKNAQLARWITRLVEQGDLAINEFVKLFLAAERHTLRQHVLKVQRAIAQQDPEEEQNELRQNLYNYVMQVAILSES